MPQVNGRLLLTNLIQVLFDDTCLGIDPCRDILGNHLNARYRLAIIQPDFSVIAPGEIILSPLDFLAFLIQTQRHVYRVVIL